MGPSMWDTHGPEPAFIHPLYVQEKGPGQGERRHNIRKDLSWPLPQQLSSPYLNSASSPQATFCHGHGEPGLVQVGRAEALRWGKPGAEGAQRRHMTQPGVSKGFLGRTGRQRGEQSGSLSSGRTRKDPEVRLCITDPENRKAWRGAGRGKGGGPRDALGFLWPAP